MHGPNKENPVTALYYFLQGQLELGQGVRLEQAGELTDDEETTKVGRLRKAKGLQQMDEAIELVKKQQQQKS